MPRLGCPMPVCSRRATGPVLEFRRIQQAERERNWALASVASETSRAGNRTIVTLLESVYIQPARVRSGFRLPRQRDTLGIWKPRSPR